MPADYEAMKKKFMGKGMGKKAAEAKAAAIHNSKAKPGEEIVGRKEGMKKKRPGQRHTENAKKLYPSHPADDADK